MKLLLLISLTVLANCKALVSKQEGHPRCIKIDECSCRLKNVKNPGLINLHGLVSDNEPRFVTEGRSEQTGIVYTFYYNPCKNFLDLVCPNASICQKHQYDYSYDYYDLGNFNTADFEYRHNSVIVVYTSSHNGDGINRTSEVELVCDETEVLGRFEYVGEPVQAHYRFKLYTQCACPGKCKAAKVECVGQDLCTCEMSDGSGTINLHSLDNPLKPMRDVPNPKQTILYNPCSAIASPDCGGHSVCEIRSDSIVGLGYANTARFVGNGIKYLADVGRPSSTVNLICDYSQRDEPLFRVSETANTYDIYSVCACPDGCDTPAPPPSPASCDQIDSCTCKSTSDNAVINLHDLDNPYAPLTTADNIDYTYYYNPCSGLKIKNDKLGECDGVAGCQGDPYADVFYSIGNTGPEISYNVTLNEFTFLYTKGSEDRSFAVRMICDPKADSPTLAADGDIPYLTRFYPLKLTTKLACF